MSGAPKRSHEDGSHSTPLKRPHEETSMFSSPSGKLIQPVGNDFHLPFDHGQDGRFAKVQRVESHDDKRSSLLHRMPIASNNSAGHLATPDSRLELKVTKDARESKSENREIKAEVRDTYTDTRIDSQASKVKNDVRIDSRGDEKELKADKLSHVDYKGDIKFEKDGHPGTSSHLSWKDTKEHHNRGKRYFEFPSDGLESWRAARPGLHNTDDVARDPSTVEKREAADTHEAVGENKIDLKSEEKVRDKDRKRKDEKYRDFAERDKDRNDRQSNIQLGVVTTERKELVREDKDADRWERERKDPQKEKERNEKEKDPIRRELSNANEKENLHAQKELADGPAKTTEQENMTFEPKRLKDDNWKTSDKDFKEKKRERDMDVGDRHEQRNKYHEKESDDVCAEGDTEKDKEVFSGIQQRRRMIRPRGTPQASHREPRFRSRTHDNEG
ncbi:uncharacterized protein [Typha latifolia]|uniref:uncharacterized protein n=1 Tax=Typha latifolia TaxID=4733 RepID=UPI003C2E1B62